MLTVTKVENKALILSDGMKVPVIVATLSDYEHSYTAQEHYNLMLRVADQAVGCVALCSYWVVGRSSEEQAALVHSLPNQGQHTTYGDNTGWSLDVYPTRPQEENAWCQCWLSYLGETYTYIPTYTGYSNFEAGLPVIFINEDNKLIRTTPHPFNGLNYRSETILPLAIHNSRYLVTQYEGNTLTNMGYNTLDMYNSNHDMDGDLSDPFDPYDDEDDSDTGGGSGGDDQDNWDEGSDEVPVPGLPDLSAVDTGFITLFNPTKEQLQNLASYLWGNLFDIDTFKKVVADPMDVILGLSIVPVDVPASSASEVKVGNIGTGVYMLKASSQYVEIDCGIFDVHEKHHSYLDYGPYTKVTLFLPFIGAQELNIDELEGTTVGVKYHVDVLSGSCVAFVTIDGSVVYQFSGQCSVSIPITSKDFTQTIMALGQLVAGGASSIAGAAASGGLSAPITAGQVAGAIKPAASGAMNVVNSKPTFEKSGNLSGSSGLLGVRYPYLLFERPKICKPANQQIYTGYPSYITRTLSSLSGFTQIMDIHLDGISCTDTEIDEILKLLREGVIL